MKRLFFYSAMTMLLALAATGCDSDPDPVPAGELTCAIAVSDITNTSASAQITPSDQSAQFYADIFPSSELEGLDEVAVTAKAIAGDGFTDNLYTGNQNLNFSDLAEQTEYTVVAFGYADGTAGMLAVKTFTTTEPKPDKVTCSIEISDISDGSASAQITPSDQSAQFYADIFPSSELEGLDESAVTAKAIAGDNFADNLFTGTQTLDFSSLAEKTKYTVVAFSYVDEVAGELSAEAFTTLERDPFFVNIELKEINQTTATVAVTPNYDDVNYFTRIITVGELENVGIADNDAYIIAFLLENPNHINYVYTGPQNLSEERLQSDYRYMVVAFNYDDPKKLFKQTFTTLEAPDPGDEFTISNVSITHTSISFHAAPHRNESWFYYLMKKTDYERYGANAMMHAYYGMQYDNVVGGYGGLDNYLKTVVKYGENDIAISGLDPESEYVVMVFYVDLENRDPTNVYDWNYTGVYFTTLTPSGQGIPEIEIGIPVVDPSGTFFTVNVKANEHVTVMNYAIQTYATVATYYDENDWSQIKAFFFLKTGTAEVIAEAKTAEGFSVSYSRTRGDYVFLVEAKNAEGVTIYEGVRIYPEYYD